jgi:uncharacterized membrane protein YgdD (TMEM256/DUF423 family)
MVALLMNKPVASALFLGGIGLFCGTVYVVTIKGEMRQRLGKLAPLGGWLLMAGWLALVVVP